MKNRLHWLEGALVAAPFFVLLGLWNELPARIPLHWNLAGEIDRWSASPRAALLFPLISLGVVALLHLVPVLDPKLRNTDQSGRMPRTLRIFRVALAAFFCTVFALQLSVAYGYPISAPRILPSSILLLFALLGNYLGNLRPNYFVGIRTPWTLENSATWRSTHRLTGRVMFFGALALLLLQFFVGERLFFLLSVSAPLALAAWSVIYSWHHFRKHAATI